MQIVGHKDGLTENGFNNRVTPLNDVQFLIGAQMGARPVAAGSRFRKGLPQIDLRQNVGHKKQAAAHSGQIFAQLLKKFVFQALALVGG